MVTPPVLGISKSPTGIQGLDEVTFGGVPKGRPTLVCGSAGSGKTMLALEFLVNGATKFGEPGVFMSFEETSEEMAQNAASLGFDLNELVDKRKLILDYVSIEKSEIEETGEYDLEGLFVRLNYAINTIGAKRVALDTIESLFAGFSNESILRAELRRLFRWLKTKGVTAVITGERGEKSLTRYGIEEYISDCVILVDQRVENQISTRRLRIVKYRGSSHGSNEYPFLIDEQGITVLPITSIGLQATASTERVSTGIPRLDTMLGGKGYFRGSSILLSGTAGTGKTSVAAHFANAACAGGARCIYFAFEESPNQIFRNMRSIGIDLEPFVEKGLLHVVATRSTTRGLEMHLIRMTNLIDQSNPSVVIVDPITNLINIGNRLEVKSMLARLVDYLKVKQVTALYTSLTRGKGLERSEVEISSLMDTWILLSEIEIGGETNRGLSILKSRGMAHSNQIREFLLTDHGVDLIDVYLGPEGVVTGTARAAQEAQAKSLRTKREREIQRLQRELETMRKVMEARVEVLRSEFEAREEAVNEKLLDENKLDEASAEDRKTMARLRKADVEKDTANPSKSRRKP